MKKKEFRRKPKKTDEDDALKEIENRHEYKMQIIIQSYDPLELQEVKTQISNRIRELQYSQEEKEVPKEKYVWINVFGGDIKCNQQN